MDLPGTFSIPAMDGEGVCAGVAVIPRQVKCASDIDFLSNRNTTVLDATHSGVITWPALAGYGIGQGNARVVSYHTCKVSIISFTEHGNLAENAQSKNPSLRNSALCKPAVAKIRPINSSSRLHRRVSLCMQYTTRIMMMLTGTPPYRRDTAARSRSKSVGAPLYTAIN